MALLKLDLPYSSTVPVESPLYAKSAIWLKIEPTLGQEMMITIRVIEIHETKNSELVVARTTETQ